LGGSECSRWEVQEEEKTEGQGGWEVQEEERTEGPGGWEVQDVERFWS
jgi:hypothetical protein